MSDDTPRQSGSLAVFETTCEEAISRLSGRDSIEADELRHEARELISTLRSWKIIPPSTDDRSLVAARVLALHRASLELVSSS